MSVPAEHRIPGPQRLVALLDAATFASLAWGAFFPYAYRLAMIALAALPLIGLAVLASARGTYRVAAWRDEATVGLTAVVLLPGIVLAHRAAKDWELLDESRALVFGSIVGVILLVLLCRLSRDLRRQPLFAALAAVLMCVYGYGALVLANVGLDRGMVEAQPIRVVTRRVQPGPHPIWYLRLKLDGEGAPSTDVAVPRPLWDAVRPRGRVCAMVRPGALGLPWRTLERCPRSMVRPKG